MNKKSKIMIPLRSNLFIILVLFAGHSLISMPDFLAVKQGEVVATFPVLISLVVVDPVKQAVLLGTASRSAVPDQTIERREVWSVPMAYLANVQTSPSGHMEHLPQALGRSYGITVNNAELLCQGMIASKDRSDSKIIINFGYVTADFSGTPQAQGSPFTSFAWHTQAELPEDHQYGLPSHTKKQLSDVIARCKRR